MPSLAALVAFGALQGAPPVVPAPTAVVATVGNLTITAEEVTPYLWAWKSREVINEIAGHKLIATEAAKLGFTATDEEIQKRITEQVAAIKANLQPGQILDDVINVQIGGPSRLALSARSYVLINKIAASEFKPASYVKAATLVFRTSPGDSTDAITKAAKAADAAYAQLEAGKPWLDVLKANEKDPKVQESGGMIGWKALTAFPEELRTQFAALNALGYTKPTQTSNGIQIFRLLARGSDASGAELADLKAQYIQGARPLIVQRLQKASPIVFKG